MNPLILLKNAAQNGDVNKLYQAIAKDSNVLEHYDKTPFAETPLHIAATRGHINFALEIMRLKPSLSKKLDEQGWSPMHVALQHNQTAMVYRLIETEPTLVGVKGREGFTPLHYVAQNDEVKLLREFLAVSPHSVMDTTNKGETALHIAVEKGNTRALEALLSFLRRSWYREALYWEEKVNWKDENGFTVLHVAVKMNDIQL
ncbi:ankyrin repeat-containing protein BDA1-like [Gossypium arboreum]|uniref:ankyrin repeat-containing protein BDA1-like n=1 Tax=Gossypium arboreum TaxID=29729 RepID=UPI0022F1BEB7|nr:ankyrin repeat-containing protein BDA1-like [Gossypium arboreum]